jgi:DNA mismatch repair ATPase MutS
MAGLPADVTARAAALLSQRPSPPALVAERPAAYTDADEVEDKAVEAQPLRIGDGLASDARELALALASVNLVAVTPLEALNLLFSLQQRARVSLGMADRERG